MADPSLKPEQEFQLRNREATVKEQELELKREESRRSKWLNPLFFAILGATIAGIVNIGVVYKTGADQRELENVRQKANQLLEREKAEAQLILEMIKTESADKAAENLQFLLDTQLISDEPRRKGILDYLKSRPKGGGVTLPTRLELPEIHRLVGMPLYFTCRYQGPITIQEIQSLITDTLAKADGRTAWIQTPSTLGAMPTTPIATFIGVTLFTNPLTKADVQLNHSISFSPPILPSELKKPFGEIRVSSRFVTTSFKFPEVFKLMSALLEPQSRNQCTRLSYDLNFEPYFPQ